MPRIRRNAVDNNRTIFLIANLALAFYNVGIIWAHEVDIFRSWKLLDARTFHAVHSAHWRKLPYWVFAPVGLSLGGPIALVWRTHWFRTVLINAYAMILFIWTVHVVQLSSLHGSDK